MKTKEFIKKVEELGYDIEISREDVFIKYDGCIIATISRTSPYTMNTYTIFRVKHVKELLDLCVEYVKTPIEEREYVKKYHLYLKRTKPKFFDDVGSYLTFNTYTNTFSIDVGVETAHLTAKFTQKEIDDIKKKYNTDLEEFEQIEVEEWKQRNL